MGLVYGHGNLSFGRAVCCQNTDLLCGCLLINGYSPRIDNHTSRTRDVFSVAFKTNHTITCSFIVNLLLIYGRNSQPGLVCRFGSLPQIGCLKEFFDNGKLLKQWNHAAIALVPKSKDASCVNDFRPISCCTVIYKIIAKILVNRLTPLMAGLVDMAQAAFIPGRSIVDNIHLARN
ncbi:hypothetical protein F511_26666 [Dorcoceras hygrometricum]|uniref:Reverse transcriptase domain-containing protein n=1 Tax=Dorcoceras hygrometricum TaxID=472368 RepID=A0A2Z7BQC2_9LAMI|nr:hypothetical protein F511_26666 [Dorcoceras hygrometricum]